nr:uncharacterized protein LOC111418462 [Onthophagus taurus]
MDIYQTFELDEKDKTLENIIEKFDKYFKPKINITYENYIVFNRKQKENESYEQYITVLKNLSSTCDFGNIKDQLNKDIFVSGINSSEAKENLLKISNLTLEKALDICRTKELAAKQIKNIENETQDIEVIRKSNVFGKCMKNHPYGKCPAYGKICSKCEKIGHFAQACKFRGYHEDIRRQIPGRQEDEKGKQTSTITNHSGETEKKEGLKTTEKETKSIT